MDGLIQRVREIEVRMREWETRSARLLEGLAPEPRTSATNLLHYLALRSEDVRDAQADLARLGLSSLGRAEPGTLWNIRMVRQALEALGRAESSTESQACAPDVGTALLKKRSEALLGPEPAGRSVRIMVTMPSEAAHDEQLVRDLLKAGMNVMRINCAHDGVEAWAGMVENLRRARADLGVDCRIVMDIEGPKLRTGVMEAGPKVVSWGTRRSPGGDLLRPTVVGIGGRDCSVQTDAWVPVDESFVRGLGAGSEIEFTDRAGRKRALRVAKTGERYALAETDRSAFIESGTPLEVVRGIGKGMRGRMGEVPAVEQIIELIAGDELVLTADGAPGRSARRGDDGTIIEPARAPITLAEACAAVRIGDRVLLDDGKAEGVVIACEAAEFTVRLTRTRNKGFRLRADKGVNLPDTILPVSALTVEDRKALGFVARHADAVEFSFVRTTRDMEDLREALAQEGAGETLGVVLKVETAKAFENLPSLLLSALTWPAAGVMIARGDLAVEVGYERLAEVQEEILWLCEAAHVPVVWATQVLESLSKKGIPSRSEITDAAMGERAECVMLNKGPYVTEAVKMLDNILRRMSGHQVKKRSMLRPLKVARAFGTM